VRRTLAEAAFGAEGSVASTVYGTVVVMATLAATFALEKRPWELAVVVFSTVTVLWAAHLYAHAIGESLARGRRLGVGDAREIARRESGMVLAAVLPCLALVLGAIGVVHEGRAVGLALAAGLATLAVEGVRYARIERFGPLATIVAVTANVALGLVVVILKITVEH
jgi:hypothetical protein